MSNYPHQPPSAYGGQYYPAPGQPPQYMNYPPQYLPYQQAPPTPQGVPYASGAAFNQNQFQHYPPPHQPQPPSIPYNYAHFAANSAVQPFSQAQSHTPYATHFPNTGIPPVPNSDYGVPHQMPHGVAPERESRQLGTISTDGAQQVLPAQPWLQTATGLDGTDEAIRRALATAGTNPADFPPLRPGFGASDPAKHPEPYHSGSVMDPQTHKEQTKQPFNVAHSGNHSASQASGQQVSTLPGLPAPEDQNTSENRVRDTMAIEQVENVPHYSMWHQKRGEARKAVTEMLRAGITLDQISQEGVDLDLLHQLFPELALGTSTSKITGREAASVSLGARSSRSLESGEVSEGEVRTENQRPNGTAISTNGKAPEAVSTGGGLNITQSTQNLPASKPGEERKDIIARLLAAKHSTAKEPAKQAAPSLDRSAHTVLPAKVGSTSGNMDTQQSDEMMPKEQSKRAEAKDQVQTEIIRKKLEALNAKRLGTLQSVNTYSRPPPNTEEQRAKPSDAMTQSTHRVESNTEVAQQGSGMGRVVSAGTSASTFTPRSNSFYADGDLQEFTGLPGLSPVLVKLPSQTDIRHPQSHSSQWPEASGKALVDEREKISTITATDLTASPTKHVTGTAYSSKPPLSTSSYPSVRKRAMASDFLDADSPPLKKRAGSDGPIQLVIDVSEEEEAENHVNDKLMAEIVPHMDRAESNSGVETRPFLSTLPSTDSINRPRDVTSMGTPKSLNDLEAEMKAMKEKIAARTRNRKAMMAQELADSAGASTGASSSGVASPRVASVSGIQTTGDVELKLKQQQQQQQQQQRSLAASRSVLQEKLEAERRTHALITAHAEHESRQAADATDDAERNNRLDRKDALEAAIPKLDASIEATVQRLESIRKQQDEVTQELERGRRERESLLKELNVLLSSEPPRPTHGTVGLGESEMKVQAPAENLTPNNESRLDVSGRSSGQSSADLPEYKRHTPATVSSRAGSAENLEEEMDMSGLSEAEGQRTRGRSEVDSLFDSKPQDKRLDQLQGDSEMPSTGATSRDEMHTGTGEEYDLSLDEQFSDDDNQEDVDPAPTTGSHEVYPESQESSSRPSEASESAEHDEMAANSRASEVPFETGDTQSPGTTTVLPERQTSEAGDVSHVHGADHGSEGGNLSDDEMSSSDEYEPPEPAGGVDVPPEVPPEISQDGPPGSGIVPAEDQGLSSDGVVGEEAGQLEAPRAPSEGRFQPYESPLIRFTSYRFHPQYVANVSGGFRSLTFSHKIRAGTPICRWETAGGVCNDATCEFQHFRDLHLTGNDILAQLSSLSEGASPEQREQYAAGLRKLVADMHEQGSADVEAAASALVAYRNQFLNDSTRVVALPSDGGKS